MANHNKRSNCTTCFHSVIETEVTCPSCGARVKNAKRDLRRLWKPGSFWLFNIAMAVWYWKPAGTDIGTAHAQEAEPLLPWLEFEPDKVFIIWLFGAMLLGALALYSKAK